MFKVFLDVGHGGRDSGAIGNGLLERDINLVEALECERVLEEYKVSVKLSRRTNQEYLSLSERSTVANKWGANLFVSIHTNAGGGEGAEVIHSIHSGVGESLARIIAGSITNVANQKVRRVFSKPSTKNMHQDYYGVIRMTRMPAVIVEGAFIDSLDHLHINTIEKQKLMGRAIAYGVLNYLKIPIYQPTTRPETEYERAIYALNKSGVINSPDYWLQSTAFNPEYVKGLIIKMSNFL